MIPSIPKKCGSIIKSGNKKIICFDNDKNAPFKAFPIEGKKVVIAICIPFKNTKNRKTLIYFVANSKYSSSPVPNRDIICAGKI